MKEYKFRQKFKKTAIILENLWLIIICTEMFLTDRLEQKKNYYYTS